jgi:hypothetical protein
MKISTALKTSSARTPSPAQIRAEKARRAAAREREFIRIASPSAHAGAGFPLNEYNQGLNKATRCLTMHRYPAGDSMAKKAKKAKKAKSALKKFLHGRSTDWMRPPRRKVAKKKK